MYYVRVYVYVGVSVCVLYILVYCLFLLLLCVRVCVYRGDDGDDQGIDHLRSIGWSSELFGRPSLSPRVSLKFVDEIFMEMHFFYPSQ